MSELKPMGSYKGVPIFAYPDLLQSTITHATPTARGLGALAQRTEAGPPWICDHFWERREDLDAMICRFCRSVTHGPFYYP